MCDLGRRPYYLLYPDWRSCMPFPRLFSMRPAICSHIGKRAQRRRLRLRRSPFEDIHRHRCLCDLTASSSHIFGVDKATFFRILCSTSITIYQSSSSLSSSTPHKYMSANLHHLTDTTERDKTHHYPSQPYSSLLQAHSPTHSPTPLHPLPLHLQQIAEAAQQVLLPEPPHRCDPASRCRRLSSSGRRRGCRRAGHRGRVRRWM